MLLPVINLSGQSAGQVEVSDEIFNGTPNDHAIYLDVRLLEAAQRAGTHKTKEKWEVRGSTRKLYRQKGTGNARQGQLRSPHHRKGGTVFGPRPRDYRFSLNKKLRRLARRSALAYKTQEQKLLVLDSIQLPDFKTKTLLNILKTLNLDTTKTLWLTNGSVENLYKASGNLEKVFVQTAQQVTTKEILHADTVLIAKDALPVLEHNLNPAKR
jgi:large subunit ribosomal protein L4